MDITVEKNYLFISKDWKFDLEVSFSKMKFSALLCLKKNKSEVDEEGSEYEFPAFSDEKNISRRDAAIKTIRQVFQIYSSCQARVLVLVWS